MKVIRKFSWFRIYILVLVLGLFVSFFLAYYFDEKHNTFYSSLYLSIFAGIITGLIVLIWTNIKSRLFLKYSMQREELINMNNQISELHFTDLDDCSSEDPDTRIRDQFYSRDTSWYFKEYSKYLNTSMSVVSNIKKIPIVKDYNEFYNHYINYYLKKYGPITESCNKNFSHKSFNFTFDPIYDYETGEFYDDVTESDAEGYYDVAYHIETDCHIDKNTCEEWYKTLSEADRVMKAIKLHIEKIIDDLSYQINIINNSKI